MNEEQFDRFLARMPAAPNPGGNSRLQKLESTAPQDWRVFRNHFLTVARINNWPELRQRRELQAAMTGEAALLTGDIDVEVAANIDAALATYDLRFIPPVAGQVARGEFHSASQRPDELVTQFHGRLRNLYLRAYPNVAVEESQQAISQFTMGLIDETTALFVVQRAPETFTAALNLAQVEGASRMTMALRRKGAFNGTMNALQINALQDMGQGAQGGAPAICYTQGGAVVTPPGHCWYCQGPHLRHECAAYLKAKAYIAAENSKSGGGWKRGKGNRGGRGGGRGGQQKGEGGSKGGAKGGYKPAVHGIGEHHSGDWTGGEKVERPALALTDENEHYSAAGNESGR